jgi:hypothetical protein
MPPESNIPKVTSPRYSTIERSDCDSAQEKFLHDGGMWKSSDSLKLVGGVELFLAGLRKRERGGGKWKARSGGRLTFVRKLNSLLYCDKV